MQPGLEQLRDIHLPDPVGWWPPAPAWWLLAVIGAALLVLLARFIRRRIRAGRYRREALAHLSRIERSLDEDSANGLRAINVLLKRTALHAFPATSCAGLHGGEWSAFLLQRCEVAPELARHARMFEEAPYVEATPPVEDARGALEFARHWIRRHR